MSSCSWRVRTVLNYKKVKYEYISIDIKKDEDKFSKEYTNISKTNKVPTLVLPNGLPIGESMAICEYLEEKYDINPLYPKDLEYRARIRNICEIVNAGTQPLQNIFVAKKTSDPKAWTKHWNEYGLKILERELKKTSGKYSFGDTITMADVFLIPQIYNGYRFGVEMNEFTTLLKIYNNVKVIEEFVKANPQNQPDCPDNKNI